LNRHIAFYCREIPTEDRERFLATMKTKLNDGDQQVFDPIVFRGTSLVQKLHFGRLKILLGKR